MVDLVIRLVASIAMLAAGVVLIVTDTQPALGASLIAVVLGIWGGTYISPPKISSENP